jgi:opacity protein-like surface antigen
MKLNFAMIAVLLTSFASAPAFADWDMPDASAMGSTIASSVANLTSQPVIQTVYSDVSGQASSGFDLSSLSSTISDATASDATGSQQQPEYTANTTSTSGTQAVSTLPECRTHALSVVSGTVDASGLAPCTLGSLADMAVTNKGQTGIYGDAGSKGPIDTTDYRQDF